jgi:flagellar M-ring protein FliF
VNTLFLQIAAQFKEFFKELGPTKRMSLLGASFVIMVASIIMVFMVAGREYGLLLSNIPSDQVPLIIGKLNEKKIPFKINDDGNSISVPKDLLPATQMSLMSELGSTKIGNVGLELFDKQDYSASSYSQKINFQRALQGELMRSINTLGAVKQSKVLLAIPIKKTFLEETAQPSASVVLELYSGKTLSPEQVRGIQHLVASGVEGLAPEKVTVVDDRGKMLSRVEDSATGGSSELLDLKRKIENDLEDRIQSILSKVAGQAKVVTKVDVTLGSRLVQSVEEFVDPEKTALRSQQSEEETMDGARTQPAGVPGTQSNLPNTEGGSNGNSQVGFKQDVKREIKTSNFEVSKTVKNIKEMAGQLEKISVAVVVDGAFQTVKNEDGTTAQKWEPRPQEDLQKYETLIKNAIGFNETRGDNVKVETMQFAQEDFSEAERIMTSLERKKVLNTILKWGLLGFSLALFFFLVVRPFMSWVTDSFQQSVDEMLPRTIEELEELHSVDSTLPGMSGALPVLEQNIDPEKAEAELLRDRIMSIVEAESEKAAGALSMWVSKRE